jgi:acetyl esterase/lipase
MFNRALFLAALVVAPTLMAATPKVVPLWPGEAPGEKGDLKAEADMTRPTDGMPGGKRVIRIGNVSKPTLTIMKPTSGKDTGASVVIFPGGGYSILAWDLEGTEVADWLNENGVTGIVLKYRVPKRPDLENYVPPLQDAQRAIGVVRANAKEWGLDPNRIGALGFSAGSHLAAALAAHTTERTYPKVDAADEVGCRPDFLCLIYPAYLVLKDQNDAINPSVKVTDKNPPTFIVMAEDDPVRVENPLAYYLELKKAKVPAEMHLYQVGGHGYGLRRTENLVTAWPDRAVDWMRFNGWLK